MGFFLIGMIRNRKSSHIVSFSFNIVAATYFSRFYPSIIGGLGLNFSVRNGKR